jgi:hypothetical protein
VSEKTERLRVAGQNICSAELRIRDVILHGNKMGRRHDLKAFTETMEEGKHDMSIPGYLEPEMIPSVTEAGRPQRGILGWVAADSPRAIVREPLRRILSSQAPPIGKESAEEILKDLCMVFEVAGGWKGRRLIIVFYYFPPSTEKGRVEEIAGALDELVGILKETAWVALLGDGNARRGKEVGDKVENEMGKELRALEKRHDLVRLRPEGTDQWTFHCVRKGKLKRSIPDHLSVSTELQAIVTNVRLAIDHTFGSDHRAIEFDMLLPVIQGSRLEEAQPRVFWNSVEEDSEQAREFRKEVEEWSEKWLLSTDRKCADWGDHRVSSAAYDSLCKGLLESAEKHIGEKTVWLKWGKSERARDLKHRLNKERKEKGGEAEENDTLKRVVDYCENLHKEVSERATAGEADRYEHFRAFRHSHWKLKKGIPGVVRDGEDLVCDPDKGLRVWTRAMKKTMEASSEGLALEPPANQELVWKGAFEEKMREAEKAPPERATNDDVEEVIKALGMKGAPGEDRMTGQIFRLVSPAVLERLVRRLLDMLLFQGSSPVAWRNAVMVPVWKKEDALDASNYRPVVLLAKLYKAVERALLRRLNCAVRDSGGLHSTNLAYQKGKGREMAIFLLTGTVLHRKFNWPGKSTLLGLLDVQHAYNGVDRHRLGLDLWDRGVRGKPWRLIMEMITHLRYRVRVNGRMGHFFEGAGLPQGATLSPQEFIIFKDGLAWALQECGIPEVGVRLIDGTLIVGALWSDDDAILAESEQGMRRALEKVAEFSVDKRVRYHGKKKGKEGKVIDFGRAKGGQRRFRIGRVWAYEADEAVFLGRVFAKPFIEGTATHVENALTRAWRKVYMLKWAGAFSGECSLGRLRLLYESLMFSVTRAHLGMLQVRAAGYKRVLRDQCKILRWWAATGQRANKVFLLAETGWMGADFTLMADKLILHDGMKAVRAGAAVRTLARGRVKDVLAGDTKGLSAEAHDIWNQWGEDRRASTTGESAAHARGKSKSER